MSGFDAVLIAGPTASGKSELALAASRHLGGKVVNADSMQVYRELSVLTAKPRPEETGGIEHFLFGHVPAARAYSVAAWLEDVRKTLDHHFSDGAIPVFAGGTGLYFKALLEGLSDIPPIERSIREKYRELGISEPEYLHELLKDLDPESHAMLKPGDRHRIIRALEVVESTGSPIGWWQNREVMPLLASKHLLKVILLPDRTRLRESIGLRFRKMVEAGGLEEAENLLRLDLDPSLPAMRAIGVPQLLAHLRGECSLEEAIETAITATRQYAKRQSTWFRNQLGDDWQIFENSLAAENAFFTKR